MTAPIDLLVFAPHPDDAELSCGGWLALAADRGQRTAIVDLTAGELASNGSPEARKQEAQVAAQILGVSHRRNLGLPDGGLQPHNPVQRDALVAVLRELQPAVVVAPAHVARHPDHAAAAQLAQDAVFFAGLLKHQPALGAPHRPTRLLHYTQRHDGWPAFVVDIGPAAERKAQAIAAHGSQVAPADAERRATLLNHPLGLQAWTVRDRLWGASIGVAYGEPYLMSGPMPVSDPVAHFAAHPHTPTLVPAGARTP